MDGIGMISIKRIIIILAVIILPILCISCGTSQVEIEPTTIPDEINSVPSAYAWSKNNDQEETSIYALDQNHVWATSGSRITFFDGSSWNEQTEIEGIDISGIFVVSDENAWISGYTRPFGGAIYHFDGSSWEEQYSQEDSYFEAITAVDPEHVWAVGNNSYNFSPGAIYFYDGSIWGKQYELDNNYQIFDICAVDTDHVWAAVTYNETGPGYVKGSGPGYVYFYDGSSWVQQFETETGNGKISELLGIYALDESHVWAAGRESGDGILMNQIYFYNGSKWEKQYEVEGTHGLWSICACDENHVWATGGSEIFFYNGSSWEKQYFIEETPGGGFGSTASIFNGISASDIDNVWAVSGSGIYYGKRQSE